MAITKTYIGGDLSILKTVLEDSGLFDSVSISEDVITCKDADNNTLFKFEAITNGHKVTAYASASVSKYASYTSNVGGANPSPRNAYSCTNGVMIEYFTDTTTRNNACIVITKTNNDEIAIVFSESLTTGSSAFTSLYAVAWGDTAPISAYTTAANAQNQTMLVPFSTNANEGLQSYTPNAGFMISGQLYSLGYGKATIGSDKYITNGYWAIKDGAAS